MSTRWFCIPFALLLLSTFAAAKNAEEPLDALKARAENAKPQDQAQLFATIARREVNEADRFYTAGDTTAATKAVDDLVHYATRATEAAQKSSKHLKETEILLRTTARRLDDVRKTLNFDDRAYVETAVKQVENLRQQLLDQMFGAPSREKKP